MWNVSLMSAVKDEAIVCRCGREIAASARHGECCTGLGAELETTVDQALIRGLVTAFRVFVSDLPWSSGRRWAVVCWAAAWPHN